MKYEAQWGDFGELFLVTVILNEAYGRKYSVMLH
jgi:hypothetical protein